MQSAVEDLKDEKVPACLYWSVEQVSDWIEELGFPNYKVTLFNMHDNNAYNRVVEKSPMIATTIMH